MPSREDAWHKSPEVESTYSRRVPHKTPLSPKILQFQIVLLAFALCFWFFSLVLAYIGVQTLQVLVVFAFVGVVCYCCCDLFIG